METRYRIRWHSTSTGATGHGTGLYSKEQADIICKRLNEDSKGTLEYWVEPVPEETE